MMRRPLILLTLAAVLAGFGCDRFPHNFQPPEETDFAAELFTPLQTAFDGQPALGLNAVMDYYADDFLRFGQHKADWRNWLQSFYAVHPDAQAAVTLINAEALSDSTAIANWRFVLSSSDGRNVLADSTFTGERLVERGGQWLLKGNQLACQPPTPLQHVIIEYFTYIGCPNCPVVEAELHDLQLAYPSQLSYLEHHITGPLLVPDDPTFSYYGPFSAPTSIFQGGNRLSGSDPNLIESYAPIVQGLAQQESKFRYHAPVLAVEGQTVTGSIQLDLLDPSLDLSDLVLNYVLIERESSYQNTQQVHLRNVVRAKGFQALSAASLGQPVLFSLNSNFPIPDDASLVIFAQTRPSPFTGTAAIHSGIEVVLSEQLNHDLSTLSLHQ